MLRTEDLECRFGYGFYVGDKVRFILSRGLELRTSIFDSLKVKYVEKSKNPDANRRVTGVITDYRQLVPGDLDIIGIMEDGYTFELRLNQCRDLKILDDANPVKITRLPDGVSYLEEKLERLDEAQNVSQKTLRESTVI